MGVRFLLRCWKIVSQHAVSHIKQQISLTYVVTTHGGLFVWSMRSTEHHHDLHHRRIGAGTVERASYNQYCSGW